MRRIVFDLDGTICTQQKSGEYHNAKPIQQVVDLVNDLKRKGEHITIFTARGMNTFNSDANKCDNVYRELTETWLKTYGVSYDVLKFGKPPADLYVDDKGVSVNEFIFK